MVLSLFNGGHAVIRFYEGSGSSEIDLLELSMPPTEWARLKAVSVKLLQARGNAAAADFLAKHPFEIYNGTNGFGEEFELLYMKVPMTTYVELAELSVDRAVKSRASSIASAIREVGKSVRFIAVELDTADGPYPVAQPALAVTSDIVERALPMPNDSWQAKEQQVAWTASIPPFTAIFGPCWKRRPSPIHLARASPSCSVCFATGTQHCRLRRHTKLRSIRSCARWRTC